MKEAVVAELGRLAISRVMVNMAGERAEQLSLCLVSSSFF